MSEPDSNRHEAEITDEQVSNNKTAESAELGDEMRKHVTGTVGSSAAHDDKTESADETELSETEEAESRHILTEQWKDLLHMAEAKGEEKGWIAETFTFPGDGKIKTERDLRLRGCAGLTRLPEGLLVGGSLWLYGCEDLTKLPKGLSVGVYLDLSGCTSLTELPEGLSVKGNFWLIDCANLTKIPKGLSVGGDLYLSKNLNEQVKKDAERMREEGRIGGKILNEN